MTVKVKNDIVRNSLAKHDIIEPGIEIISQDENKLYSPAAQAKAKEHMQWKKDTEDTKKKTLHAMNHLHHTSSSLPLSVKILSTPVTRKRP